LNRSVEALRSFRSKKPQDGQQRTEDKTEAHELALLSPQGFLSSFACNRPMGASKAKSHEAIRW
jgi:hypothetical protein